MFSVKQYDYEIECEICGFTIHDIGVQIGEYSFCRECALDAFEETKNNLEQLLEQLLER